MPARVVVLLALFIWPLFGFMFQSVSPLSVKILQKGENAPYCSNCGMDLATFYRTNHAAKEQGEIKQFCSMHCLVERMQTDAKLSDIKVVDAKSLRWIDAKRAYYVVGSSVRGTMSRISKYAFGNISDAKEFQSIKGGRILSFKEALEVAKQDFAK